MEHEQRSAVRAMEEMKAGVEQLEKLVRMREEEAQVLLREKAQLQESLRQLQDEQHHLSISQY